MTLTLQAPTHAQPSNQAPSTSLEITGCTQKKQLLFKPYVMHRCAALPIHQLNRLTPTHVFHGFQRIDLLTQKRQTLGKTLADQLYTLIPHSNDKQRRVLLNLRRQLHNDRLPNDTVLTPSIALLSTDHQQRLTEIIQLHHRIKMEWNLLKNAWEDELTFSHQQLINLAQHPEFLKGIQLSGERLLKEIQHYIASDLPKSETKKNRQTQLTLTRYLVRMATRTTPFAGFTQLALTPFNTDRQTQHSQPLPPKQARHVKINRGLLSWMRFQLCQHPEFNQSMWLYVNNTLTIKPDGIHALVRGQDGSEFGYWAEKIIHLKTNTVIVWILNTLKKTPCTQSQLLKKLSKKTQNQDKSVELIRQLLSLGLLELRWPIDEQEPNLAHALQHQLQKKLTATHSLYDIQNLNTERDLTKKQIRLSTLKTIFIEIESIENHFSTANLDQRSHMIHRLDQQIKAFCQLCHLPIPEQVNRTHIYEDVAKPEAEFNQAQTQTVLKARNSFHLLHSFLRIFDYSLIEKLSLYQWFNSALTQTERELDVVSIYQIFSSQDTVALSGFMNGQNSELAQTLILLRKQWYDLIDQKTKHHQGTEIHLSSQDIETLIQEIPSTLPLYDELAFRFQLDPSKVLLNEACSGHGMFFSRFQTLFNQQNASFSVNYAHNNTKPNADLWVSFGLNVNLHPQSTPLVINYPGIADAPKASLSLRDLGIRSQANTAQLELYLLKNGQAINLTPMNFMYPGGAPLLYRFLCLLSQHVNIKAPFLGTPEHDKKSKKIIHYPRIILNNEILLTRKQWWLTPEIYRTLMTLTQPQKLKQLQEIWHWYRQLNLPQTAFFYWHPFNDVSNDWGSATEKWAKEARSARSKPAFIDFHSPLLIKTLVHHLNQKPPGFLVLYECMPEVSNLNQDDVMTEFMIETHYQEQPPQSTEKCL